MLIVNEEDVRLYNSVFDKKPTTVCGLSVNGYCLVGDKKSIDAAQEWMHSHVAIIPYLRGEVERLRKHLEEIKTTVNKT